VSPVRHGWAYLLCRQVRVPIADSPAEGVAADPAAEVEACALWAGKVAKRLPTSGYPLCFKITVLLVLGILGTNLELGRILNYRICIVIRTLEL
jgi:hypothetical protein